jgi:hypothetical protein
MSDIDLKAGVEPTIDSFFLNGRLLCSLPVHKCTRWMLFIRLFTSAAIIEISGKLSSADINWLAPMTKK